MNNNIQKLLRYPSLIKLLLQHPGRNFTPHELSKLTNIPYSTVWRYVKDLKQLGLISVEKIGQYNICRLNESSPIISKLNNIIDLDEMTLQKVKGRDGISR